MMSQQPDANADFRREKHVAKSATMTDVHLARRIAAARKAMNLTQTQVAHRLGTTSGTISRIERGLGELPRYLHAYLELLGLDATGSPLRVRGATGAPVASTPEKMATQSGPQLPAELFEVVSANIRNEMVNLALDRGDPYEVVRGLRAAKPPLGATIAWWAGHYADLLETHRRSDDKGGETR